MRTFARWLGLLLLLAAAAQAADIPESFRVFSEPVTARALLGQEVRTRSGERVGVIEDLVFDLAHNRVHRVLVGSAAYPMNALDRVPGASHRVLDQAHAVEQPWGAMRLVRASRLLAAGAADIVIDAFWGEVAFAAVTVDGLLRPVPLDAFHLEGGEPVLRVARSKLAALEGFTRSQLDAKASERAFLQRNARLAHRLTPP